MEKEFVPNEPALELKNLGFDEDCFGYYDTEGLQIRYDVSNPTNKNSLFTEHSITNNPKISAPTFSQAFRFFGEKYGLFISFARYRNSAVIEMPDTFSKVYEIWIQDENEDESIWVGGFDGHGEAESACLDKLIEIVKKK